MNYSVVLCMFLTGCVCAESSAPSTTETSSEGGAGGVGGTGGDEPVGGSGGTGGEGGAVESTVTITTAGLDRCRQKVCSALECGPVVVECGGVKEYIDCGGCDAPAACLGSNELNKCGTRCLAKPEYAEACGDGVEYACDNTGLGCGFAYKYVDGKPVFKVVGVSCPTAIAADGTEVRCCVPGCGGDC